MPALDLLLAAAALPAVLLAAYLVVLAVAAALPRPLAPPAAPGYRLAVVIPAHDEAALIARAIGSLAAQEHPPASVLVVADHCTDGTAAVARQLGAGVIELSGGGERGKGRALRAAFDHLLALAGAPDGIAVVDADSVAEPGLLRGLAARLAAGAPAAQAEYLALPDPAAGLRGALVETALLLFHRVRLGGLARLGLGVPLVGNGMAFSAQTLRAHRWEAFSAIEDLEFSLRLRHADLRVEYAGEAVLRAPVASGRGAVAQRTRWEGGRLALARRHLPRLLVRALFHGGGEAGAAALDLAVPPLGLFGGLVIAGGALAAVPAATGHGHGLAAWALAALLLALYLPAGLLAARAPRRSWAALAATPWFVARKAMLYAGLVRGFDGERWDRDHRGGPPSSGARVAGVRIDPVDTASAVDRIVAAATSGSRLQVCTVNLDFLVSARRRPEVMAVLNESGLNVADGAPVVWLSRVAGQPLPERVTGLDLVPLIAAELESAGRSLFLLGGEDGAAGEAARALRRRFPSLRVGSHEPPRGTLADLAAGDSAARVRAFAPDVLLVALGHPKQELFIAREQDRLGVPVAIGVGCCFDLLAGRVTRAPRWMRASGLEWLHRAANEPRRLARRYLVDSLYLGLFAAGAAAGRFELES